MSPEICAAESWSFTQPDWLTPQQIELAIAQGLSDLAKRDISSDVFLRDPGVDRTKGLFLCDDNQRASFFIRLQTMVTWLPQVPVDRIGKRMEALYRKAYGEKQAGLNVVNALAKQELDLWIGALYNEAFDNKQFLQSVRSGLIEKIIALSSPNLLPKDRLLFQKYEKAPAKTTPDLFQEMYARYFAWAKDYEVGSREADDPGIQSLNEFERALIASVGEDKYRLDRAANFPQRLFDDFISEAGLESVRDFLADLTKDKLQIKYAENSVCMMEAIRSGNFELAKECYHMVFVARCLMDKSGVSYELKNNYFPPEIDQFYVRGMQENLLPGVPEEGARMALACSDVADTTTRLDDYACRFYFRDEAYPKLFSTILKGSLAQAISSPKGYGAMAWMDTLFDPSMMHVPVLSRELDSLNPLTARKQLVLSHDVLDSSEFHMMKEPKAFSMGELLPLLLNAVYPAKQSHLMEQKLGYLLKEGTRGAIFENDVSPEWNPHSDLVGLVMNLDAVIVAPDSFFSDEPVTGQVHKLMRTVVLRQSDVIRKLKLSPAALLADLMYAAALTVYWWHAREAPEPLAFMQRKAAVWAIGYLNGISNKSGISQTAHEELDASRKYYGQIIMRANHVLGFAINEASENAYHSPWPRGDNKFMTYDPEKEARGVLQAEKIAVESKLEREGAAARNQKQLNPTWEDLQEQYCKQLQLSESDRKKLTETLAHLDKLDPHAESIAYEFTNKHLIFRFINWVLDRKGWEPLQSSLKISGSSWMRIKQAALDPALNHTAYFTRSSPQSE